MRRQHPSPWKPQPKRHTLRSACARRHRCCACSPTSASSPSCGAGNHGAFEALVSRYQSRLLAFCRHMLGSREDAEDVLQEVFAAAYNAMLADDRPINVRPWLYRIARNRSLNHLRRRRPIGVDSMDIHLVGERHDDRRQGPQPRGVPPAHRRRPGAARDAAHRAAAARDRRALLRADRRGDGDHRPVGEVAARPRPRLAGRGRRGAQAHLRGGPRRARRGRRGPAPHSPPVRRHLRTCDRCAAFRKQLQADQQGARRASSRSAPLLLLQEVRCSPSSA